MEKIIMQFFLPENNNVEIILKQGDITEERVDAIVNAANSRLQHGGGVAGAIVRKGGWSIQDESNKIGFVRVGQSALTGAGKLPAEKIIHTVGPQWGEGDEINKLSGAVHQSLKLADENKLMTISFPAVSSGIFGFPKDKCAEVMLASVRKYLKENPGTGLKKIIFCIIDDLTVNVFKEMFQKLMSQD
ncbi:MAG: macro domain-containing protein [bacterium]|nr:macro domain-containing protein [bacterium]